MKRTVRLAVCTWYVQIACVLGCTVLWGYTVPDGHTAFVKPLASITIEHSPERRIPCQQSSSSFLMRPVMHASGQPCPRTTVASTAPTIRIADSLSSIVMGGCSTLRLDCVSISGSDCYMRVIVHGRLVLAARGALARCCRLRVLASVTYIHHGHEGCRTVTLARGTRNVCQRRPSMLMLLQLRGMPPVARRALGRCR